VRGDGGRLLTRFYAALPVRLLAAGTADGLLAAGATRRLGRTRGLLATAAALLATGGFLAYYLPVYRAPHRFPVVAVPVPGLGVALPVPWGELAWAVGVGAIELLLLTLLNVAGVHEVAVCAGLLTPATKPALAEPVLDIGLERPVPAAARYGIDPFEGIQPWALLLFNVVLRLKGWLAGRAVRALVRLLVGRYATRALLDFSGLPLYMALNAYSVHAVMREARVAILGRAAVDRFLRAQPRQALDPGARALLYDTLQYIAVSKRDFHRNHQLLTRGLLGHYGIPVEARHPLPPDYLDRLARAPAGIGALCRDVLRLGFVLDGQLSWRERLRIRTLNRRGLLDERAADLARAVRAFLGTGGLPATELVR
jgi:hypothetical protein